MNRFVLLSLTFFVHVYRAMQCIMIHNKLMSEAVSVSTWEFIASVVHTVDTRGRGEKESEARKEQAGRC